MSGPSASPDPPAERPAEERPPVQRVAVLGAGAWGTALAIVARRAGRQVVLQAHEPAVADEINRRHENTRYLPGVTLAADIRATAGAAEAIADADAVLLATPAQVLRGVLTAVAGTWPAGGPPAVICAKGIERAGATRLSEVVRQVLPTAPIAVLSGPSFAIEVARGLPAAVTLACREAGWRQALPMALGSRRFRVYSTDDVIGVELGGAIKNVLAIACGVVEGRGLGDNARAALITRGLAEMVRLVVAVGGRAETVIGLSGLGDLVLTSTAMQSRNFSLGFALGRGETLAAILGARHSVAEGVYTAAAVVALARRHGVDAPIATAVDAVLNRGADLDRAIEGLLDRPLRAEFQTMG